ncbi:MAG: nucleotidyltransferase family protein [Candidatus Omnitrophota bacterium]
MDKKQSTLRKDDALSYLGAFKERNRSKYHILKLGLFGSFARNEMREDSDIDIVVELEKPDMFNLIGIKQDLEEVFSRSVDIVRMRKNMNKFLEGRIKKEAIFV